MTTAPLRRRVSTHALAGFLLAAAAALSACTNSPMATVPRDGGDGAVDSQNRNDTVALGPEAPVDTSTVNQPETGAPTEAGSQLDTSTAADVGTDGKPGTTMSSDAPAGGAADSGALADGSVYGQPETGVLVDIDAGTGRKLDAGATEAGATEAGGSSQTEVGSLLGAVLVVSVGSINIGTIDVGKTVSGAIALTNVGTTASGPLTLLPGVGMTVAGDLSALLPGDTRTIIWTTTPTTVGSFASSISIAANPGAQPPLAIKVIGLAVEPGQFSVTPAAIDLGTIPVGATAPKQTITVTAQGALTDLSILSSGADVKIEASSTCVSTLAAGTTCTVVASFVTAFAGPKSDSIVISAGNLTRTVAITATAVPLAKLAISPATVAFAAAVNAESSAVVLNVVNIGGVSTGALNASITGADAIDFKIVANDCMLLDSASFCAISVVFAPRSANTSSKTARLTVQDNNDAGGSAVQATLTGTVYSPPTLAITSAQSDLGSVPVGATGAATVFTVTNSGDAASGPLEVSVTSSEFAIVGDACTGVPLAKDRSCTVSLALKPTTLGTKSATLQVAGTSGSPAIKTITGSGIP